MGLGSVRNAAAILRQEKYASVLRLRDTEIIPRGSWLGILVPARGYERISREDLLRPRCIAKRIPALPLATELGDALRREEFAPIVEVGNEARAEVRMRFYHELVAKELPEEVQKRMKKLGEEQEKARTRCGQSTGDAPSHKQSWKIADRNAKALFALAQDPPDYEPLLAALKTLTARAMTVKAKS